MSMHVDSPAEMATRCVMPPHPDLLHQLQTRLAEVRRTTPMPLASRLSLRSRPRVGFDDGLVRPGTELPLGTSAAMARASALHRDPLRGTVRVIVVLADFSDRPMTQTADHFRDLFFSTGKLPHGSVREYYTEVSRGLIDIDGEVVGPLRMPHSLADYAGRESGTQQAHPNAQDLAAAAAAAANKTVDFTPYDNNHDGYVDAFVVVHAGEGAEETGAAGDIWSHKYVLPKVYRADQTKIYGYLTIPENAKIGVCAHELGHLLFGWPDLYDTDYSSNGVGDFCLMAGGSWGGGGDQPCHPSAWCKVNQGWVDVDAPKENGPLTIADVKDSHQVVRLWKHGEQAKEYFLLENRQRTRFDESLPAGGLLVWHIDDAVADNTNDAHPKVALMQADGRSDLEHAANRGDAGDPYPGKAHNVTFDDHSTPNSRSYAGSPTQVAVTHISAPGPAMTATIAVHS